jgi:pyruvate-formate lyase-activating enzyme
MFKITKHAYLYSPDSTAAIVFFPKCNLACPYCFNIDLYYDISTKDDRTFEGVIEFINSRHDVGPNGPFNKVDWISFSGGECTLLPNELSSMLDHAKNLGFKTCVYTNGTTDGCHEFIVERLRTNKIDAVMLDYKWLLDEYTTAQAVQLSKTIREVNAERKDADFYFWLNTTTLRTKHTKEYIKEMSIEISRLFEDQISPIYRSAVKSTMKLAWTLTPFFNERGRAPTLGGISSSESLTPTEIVNICHYAKERE